MTDQGWPLYEVFLRGKRGLNHVHVGSLHAADAEMALHHARDLYTRRNEGVSIWVVRSSDITASSPDEKDPFFKPVRRQGVPPPDVLRHPRRRPAHVRTPPHEHSRRTRPDFDDNPYDLLAEDHDEGHRWAFGTGFTDPLEGVDTSVPDGLDPARWPATASPSADDALIYSHRLQQWVARLPELEEETAVANIALDLLGQARLLLARAGGIVGQTEDQLAFFREEKEFRNVRLAEHADRDFAELVVRLLMFSTWRLALFEALAGPHGLRRGHPGHCDPVLAAIAAKGVNELAYHRDYAASWVVRLGDGTPLSHAKTQAALDTLWPLLGELFRPDPDALALPRSYRQRWRPVAAFDAVLDTVLAAAALDRPRRRRWPRSAAGPAATACTPRRWATSSPSSSPSPAPTRTRHGSR